MLLTCPSVPAHPVAAALLTIDSVCLQAGLSLVQLLRPASYV